TNLAITRNYTDVYIPGTIYTLLHASNGVTGTYTNVTQTVSPFLDLITIYDANNVRLQIALNPTPMTFYAYTPNQLAVAVAAALLPEGNEVHDALISVPTQSIYRAALDALSGEIHASAASMIFEDSRYIRDAALNRLPSSLTPTLNAALHLEELGLSNTNSTPNSTIWAEGFGSWGDFNGDYNTAALHRDTKGFFIGSDKIVGDGIKVGLLGGFSHSNMNVNARQSTGQSDNVHLGWYAGKQLNQIMLGLGGAYTYHDIDTERLVSFPGFYNQLYSNYKGSSGQAFGEAGYVLNMRHVGLEPFSQLAYVRASLGQFAEHGGNGALTGKS
ncbi:MAG: autotransporter domain-containing protein, partial [bacterium]|nr:autotransporter domain-containing protein [bacterium]